MGTEQRIERLRQVENECYSICYYLLQSENPAHEAAKLALKQLYRNDRFFAEPKEETAILRREAMNACFLVQEGNSHPAGHDAIA